MMLLLEQIETQCPELRGSDKWALIACFGVWKVQTYFFSWKHVALKPPCVSEPHCCNGNACHIHTATTLTSVSLLQKMTYVTQLEEYEEAVMKKRLEEMPEDELQRLLLESESLKKKSP
jgi:hypothetical protein